MSELDFYQILQIAHDADARTIQSAYRRLARQYHPDTGTGQASEERMKQINLAYSVLSDTDKRQAYDRKHFGRTSEQHTAPSQQPPPTGAFREGVLHTANFRHYDPRWTEIGLDWAKTQQHDGFYYISVLKPNFECYSHPSWVVKNFAVSVDAQLIAFTPTTEIGFVYRLKIHDGTEQYSRITLRPDGYCGGFHIGIEQQKVTLYQAFLWFRSDNMLRCDDQQTNTLRLRVVNGYAELSLNGQPITIFDATPLPGFAGLVVRHGGDGSIATARFTNFRLAAIE